MSEDFDDIPGLRDDLGALALARRLARTDFSGDSRVRSALRRRLLARPLFFGLPARLLVAFAMAALAVWLPLRRDRPLPPPFPLGENGLPVLPGRFDADPSAKPEPVFVTRPTSLKEIFIRPGF